jgi:hypothetical protein
LKPMVLDEPEETFRLYLPLPINSDTSGALCAKM